jgi:hypothetical protein
LPKLFFLALDGGAESRRRCPLLLAFDSCDKRRTCGFLLLASEDPKE